MSRNLREELSNWDGQFHTWQPEPGDMIVGILQFVEQVETEYGVSKVATILDDEDHQRKSVWLSSTVLANEWQRQMPSIGDRIGIKYGGKHEKGYHMYALLVDNSARQLSPVTIAELPPIDKDKYVSDPFADQ